MKCLHFIFSIVLFVSCKQEVKVEKLELGKYRAVLKVDDSIDLPFNFEVITETKLKVFNAE